MEQFMRRRIIKHDGAGPPRPNAGDVRAEPDFDFVAELHEAILDSTEQCPACHARVTAAVEAVCEKRGTLGSSRPGVKRNGAQDDR